MRIKLWAAILASAFLLFPTACGSKAANDDEVAVLETNYGKIVIEFLPNVAPRHTKNFKELTREGFYDGTKFHRIFKDRAKVYAIQGGDPNTINGDPSIWGQGQKGQRMIRAEFSSLKHDRGIVSAARKSDDIDSATSQFFICVAPQPSFDGQYSIFGRVIDGMNVVDSIARAPLEPKSERPVDPVVVNRAYLVRRADLN